MKKLFLFLFCISLFGVLFGQDTTYKFRRYTYINNKLVTWKDVTKDYKKLNDSLEILKALKYKPIIHMPVLRYDSGQYKWAGVFKPLTVDTSHVYMVVINPDTKPINYKYYGKCASGNVIPKKVRATIISQTDDPNDPWYCNKASFEMKYQGEYFYLTLPPMSFVVFNIEKKE